jgi:hydroxylamine reductase
MESFCYQCEQTVAGGCVSVGNCGKDPTTSVLQDLVFYAAKGVAQYARRAADLGHHDDSIGQVLLHALFATVTNVNFDPARLADHLNELDGAIVRARALYEAACDVNHKRAEALTGPATWRAAPTANALIEQASLGSLKLRLTKVGADVTSLQEIATYGLKGLAAYAEHARVLGRIDRKVYAFIYETLDLLTRDNPSVDELVAAALKVGEINLHVMGMLDGAHTTAYGHPVPTPVRVTPVAGKCILVSGHDLKDLELLLEQTAGKGINVYTHGEMLPAHGYPALKKYPHLVGNYGGAWQDQREEFEKFPGSILMTTNCIQKPKGVYQARIFTSGLVAWPGVTHIADHDFSAVIAAALEAPGFTETEAEKTILVGFGHQAVLSVADKVVDAVKSGALKHFFLIGGCDGAKSGRNYYTELAEAIPNDCAILTLACGKYRFNKLDFGDIGGIPRLLDIGQCNDAYSAIQIAVALSQAFNTDVNSLPLSLVLSWYEQKAVAVLLTLLHLGIKNIRLGPTLPAFVSPAVLDVLVKNFNIMPITTVEQDLAAMLGR